MNAALVVSCLLLAGLAIALGIALLRSRSELGAANVEKAGNAARLQSLELERTRLDSETKELRASLSDVKATSAVLESEKRTATLALEQRSKELAESHERMTREFENLANKIFEQKTQTFQNLSQKGLEAILNPVKERLREFEGKVEQFNTAEVERYTGLREQLDQVVKLNSKLSEDANNLSDALKGESKTRGNWGELVLERILESSGLTEGNEYVREGKGLGVQDEDGNKQRPDVVIQLPGDKHIVVNSKLELVAYERFWNEKDEDLRAAHLKDFLAALGAHVEELKEKHYPRAKNLRTPDFVILFMPTEGAFSTAVQADVSILLNAWEKNVMIVGPSTLLPCLKTVAFIWQHEKQNRNVQEIAKQAGLLYDKFVSLVSGVDEARKHMRSAQESLDSVRDKIVDGRGNLVSKVEKLKLLGAKTEKALPKEYLLEDATGAEPPAEPLQN